MNLHWVMQAKLLKDCRMLKTLGAMYLEAFLANTAEVCAHRGFTLDIELVDCYCDGKQT